MRGRIDERLFLVVVSHSSDPVPKTTDRGLRAKNVLTTIKLDNYIMPPLSMICSYLNGYFPTRLTKRMTQNQTDLDSFVFLLLQHENKVVFFFLRWLRTRFLTKKCYIVKTS